jgi:hypothetical protein
METKPLDKAKQVISKEIRWLLERYSQNVDSRMDFIVADAATVEPQVRAIFAIWVMMAVLVNKQSGFLTLCGQLGDVNFSGQGQCDVPCRHLTARYQVLDRKPFTGS